MITIISNSNNNNNMLTTFYHSNIVTVAGPRGPRHRAEPVPPRVCPRGGVYIYIYI